jgi:eukaryotic-like serine/threonine-protein kinase
MPAEVNLGRPTSRIAGEVLGSRYQIELKIGEGAMGTVYRAKHVKVGRPFAVKILHPRLLEDDKVLQRFEREAELAGRLRHPNVIGVVDVGETTDGMRYMVMDFAEGPDLATLLNEAPFTPQRIIHITRQLLEGLYHAHEQGLIHRDFKPENVIIEKDTHGHEVPRIVDFGIAILREGGDSTSGPGRLTTNGLVLGTPHYMAPEQAVADPIDHRIDLFALGIIIYEMLSGKLPFDGSGAEVARANLLLDPPPISERVPYLAVDPLLEAFARHLMAKKRDKRPATAKVARDLLNLIESNRLEAAAALGVPLDAVRTPAQTEDAAPIRHHSGNETFPPPIRAAQAPAMSAPKAVAATATPHVTTQQTEVKKRRAPLIAAAVAALGVLGAAAFVMTRGDSDTKPADKVAVTPEPPQTAPPAPVEPPQETKPVEVPPPSVEAKVEPATNVEPPVETKAAPVETKADTAPKATQKITKKTPKTVTTPKTTPKAGATTVTTNPQTTQVTPPPVETKPAEPKVVTADMVAKQYQSVGAQLRALQDAKGQDAVSDLWSRYRMIRITDAMANQAKRDETASVLSKLTVEIAARKK